MVELNWFLVGFLEGTVNAHRVRSMSSHTLYLSHLVPTDCISIGYCAKSDDAGVLDTMLAIVYLCNIFLASSPPDEDEPNS
jgi:hypothetical protein